MHASLDKCCPECSGVVMVDDDNPGDTHYWCVTCERAVDPVEDVDEEPRANLSGAVSWRVRALVFAIVAALAILALVDFCGVAL